MEGTGEKTGVNNNYQVRRSCLKTCYNADGTDTKSKTVKFADSCGMLLTSVHIFHYSEEICNCSCELEYALKKFTRKNSQGLFFNQPWPRRQSKLLNFAQPFTLQFFYDKVESNRVSLASVVCREYSIFGSVIVSNIAFDKKVSIRYTRNSWKSTEEVNAWYVHGTCTGKTDTFSFEIPFNDSNEGSAVKFEFAIKYQVSDDIFWDNNYGENYQLLCSTESKLSEDEIESTEQLGINRQKLSTQSGCLGLCRIRRLPMLKSVCRWDALSSLACVAGMSPICFGFSYIASIVVDSYGIDECSKFCCVIYKNNYIHK